MNLSVRLFTVIIVCTWMSMDAWADVSRMDAPSSHSPTPNLYGSLGLNTVPSARMDTAGTIRASVSAADPYIHTQFGYQLTDGFYFGLRQTNEISNLREDPDKVFPGLDLKLRLFKERKFRPAIALGLQSAFGDKRLAGEYLSFSKRYNNFDFTAGFGWGRFGTRNKFLNPLDWTGSLFSDKRQLDGDKPNGPRNWFTGDTGVFAGIEYDTPWKGVSLKADISSDSYKAERALGQDGPSAYSFGVSYQPADWVDAGIAWLDNDTVMARISFKSLPEHWPFHSSVQNYGTVKGEPQLKHIRAENNIASAQLYLNDTQTLPYQLGQSFRTLETKKANSEIIRIEPIYFGLIAPAVNIDRRDLTAAEEHRGSAEEIWRNAGFDENLSGNSNISKYIPRFILRENFSLSEDDSPFLHRFDLLATLDHQVATNFLVENSLRYNLFSNIDHIQQTRIQADSPVRSDIANYLVKPLAVERAFVQGFKSFSTDWHVTASAGYLEEMFAGYHGEILYRPWGKNWAIGLEAANVIKRDYETPLNLGYFGHALTTGHANFYYEIPDTAMTLQASLGRYLAKNEGGTLSLKNRFSNGATVEAFITATNMSDPDPYGASDSLSSGLRFTLPLGSVRYIPDGSGIEINAEPVGRDAGQRLDIAHKLYDMTEPLSYRNLTRHWGDVTN